MAKPLVATTVEDSCQCGALLSLVGPDARLITEQHDMWLEHHAPCQEWHDHWWERLWCWLRAVKAGERRG